MIPGSRQPQKYSAVIINDGDLYFRTVGYGDEQNDAYDDGINFLIAVGASNLPAERTYRTFSFTTDTNLTLRYTILTPAELDRLTIHFAYLINRYPPASLSLTHFDILDHAHGMTQDISAQTKLSALDIKLPQSPPPTPTLPYPKPASGRLRTDGRHFKFAVNK